jgi:hypothetical protein
MTVLDDLLSYDDEPAKPRRSRRSRRSRWVWLVVGCAFVAWIVEGTLRQFGYGVPIYLAFALALALTGLVAMVNRIGAGLLPDTLLKAPPPPPAFEQASADGILDGVKSWQKRYHFTGTDAKRFAAGAQHAMIEVLDERLRLRHGVSRDSDPDRARDLLGPELWKFANEPVSRLPSVRDLARLVAAMEAL